MYEKTKKSAQLRALDLDIAVAIIFTEYQGKE